jgi:hypothetical protein
MQRVECEFEAEVLAAAIQSRWPDRVDASLRAHAEDCEICRDVAAIAGAIESAREDSRAHAHVPDAGRVWWLAQIRARREAARAAARPIEIVQIVAAVCAIVVAAVLCVEFNAAGLLLEHGMVAVGVAALLCLAPAAAWYALHRD